MKSFVKHHCKQNFCLEIEIVPVSTSLIGTETGYHVRNLVAQLVFEQTAKKIKKNYITSVVSFLKNASDLCKIGPDT